MTWKNTAERFGVVAKSFHWLVAAIVICVIGVGLYMSDLDPSPLKFSLSFWHKSFGVTILALMVLRLVWRFANTQPAALENHKRWEKLLARAIHGGLYICLFAMPLSGWAMSSAKGFGVSVFGWFTLPDIVGENKELGEVLNEAHEIIADILIICIVLHFGGALKHHIVDKDSTLRRMLPFGKVMFALTFLTFTAAPARAADPVTAWAIDHTQSHLTFEATQMKAPFTGEFARFDGDIHFDPARLEDSSTIIKIDMTSVSTKSEDRDANLITSPWFFTESFPESKFEAAKFEKTGENAYVAHGNLTIRDVTLPVDLPFTLDITTGADGQKTAKMKGELTLQRLDYGVGTGDWQDTSNVGNPVKVLVLLTANAVIDAPPQ